MMKQYDRSHLCLDSSVSMVLSRFLVFKYVPAIYPMLHSMNIPKFAYYSFVNGLSMDFFFD